MNKALAALAISMAIVFPVGVNPIPAHAATCAVQGGQSGRLKYSSQTSTISATVCGNQIWKLIGKPKKPSKPIRPSKPRKYANNFTVVPDRPSISGPKELKVSEAGAFLANSVRHTRNRLLFWYPSQVRFSPKVFSWSFGDRKVGNGQTIQHDWQKIGTYQLKLLVGFSVKYRIIGHSGWITMPGLVYSSSAPLAVQVGAKRVSNSQKVFLVHWRCTEKPNAIGC
jgi:hypothetical protein